MNAGFRSLQMRAAKQPHSRRRTRYLPLVLGLIWAPGDLAQGPSVEYFYNSDTTFGWASCAITQKGGSQLRVPFLPVVVTQPVQAPLGTAKYTRNVLVNAPLVFLGDGIASDSWSAYKHTFDWEPAPIDVKGKAALICYDCASPDVAEDSPRALLAARIQTAASNGAVAVVLFSVETEAPFLYLESSAVPSPEIPVITISPSTAAAILDATAPHGKDLLGELAGSAEPPMSRSLIAELQLRVDGAFDRLESDHFLFLFRATRVDRAAVAAAAHVHEAALDGIRSRIGTPEDRPWRKSTTVYFAGFDSKLFFTHHWGFGLSNSAGTFLQWDGGTPDAGRIAHEHTHTYTALNWGDSSSFIDEGVARYIEAELTDASMNHRASRCALDRDELPPLRDMLDINIGAHELTPLAYPAAGSLVAYLVETGGMKTLRRVYELEGREGDEAGTRDTWEQVLNKTLAEVDQDWRSWLKSHGPESDCER